MTQTIKKQKRIPWNKGKIGLQVAWNKGLAGRAFSQETKEKMRQAKLGNKYRLNTKHSEETKRKISMNSAKLWKGKYSEQHPSWKGNNVKQQTKYIRVHRWINRQFLNENKCENCQTLEAKKYEWANLSGKYLYDTSDWARLCTRCHQMIDDNRKKQWHNIKDRQWA
jgi:hypothetical protein